MKKVKSAFAIATLLCVAHAAGAQEMAVRVGLVTMMQPLADTQGAISASTKRQWGGMLGRVVGRAVSERTGYTYEAVAMASSLGADVATAGDRTRAGAIPYMLVIRLADNSEVALQRTAAQLEGITLGARVKLIGSGEGAVLVAD